VLGHRHHRRDAGARRNEYDVLVGISEREIPVEVIERHGIAGLALVHIGRRGAVVVVFDGERDRIGSGEVGGSGGGAEVLTRNAVGRI
jgi:hypothetical protein